ncbi:hypothetical protein ARMSODRAFT_1079798 [Armillaria solidipes]|uniref:Uncharacterized protein n=1 Tax=Armillaria solidipes TaxID=1076256 RepID=A0A2H3BXJ5_9AGAR|nr:hypothetical protein ARMSODRAFT_1079798 [Armillaria solidipes]
MTTAVVDPVLQPITLANAPVREKAEDFGGAAPRDADDDFKVAADKPKDASTTPIVKPEEDKENAGTQEEQTSLSVSDDSTVPKVTPAIDDTVLAVEIPTELGMDKKASSIPVTVALASDMVSSSVLAVEHSEDTQVKNDNELASVIDSPNEEISSLPASVTPQPTKVDGIPAPVLNPTFENQVKFVAPEQLDLSSRPSDVKTDVVAIDDVVPDVLEGISSADKDTIPDNAPVAAGGVPLVEDAIAIERLQAAKDEAILGEESLGKEEHPEVTAPMAQKEPGPKDIPVLDSAQSPQEPPTVVTTYIVEKDAVIEDDIVIEKAPLIEEEKRVAAAEGAVAVGATPATITSENFEAPSASFLEAPIPEGTTVEQPVSADVAGTMAESVKTGEEVGGREDLQLATTIATKTTPLEDETPTVSVIEAAPVEEGEAATFEAKEDDLEKTLAVEADSIVEVKELDKGGALPSVERHELPSPLAEEALIVEVATSKEAGPAEAVIEGSSTSAVTVPPVEEPTSAEDVSVESARTSEQATVEQPSTTTVLTASVVSKKILLGESVTSVESPAVEEKVIVSSTPKVRDAPIIAERLDPVALTSVTEDPLAVPIGDNVSVAKVSTGEEEDNSSTPVAELTTAAEVDLTFATDEPAEIVEPSEEVPAAHVPFVRQPSAVEVPVGDKSMVAEETSASEVASIPAGDTLAIEEATGEPTVTGIPETEIAVETTSLVVDETPAYHAPVAISVPTKELEAAETEVPVEKELPVDDSLIVEETTTEELSVVKQGVQVFSISENPPAIEEVLEEASVIRPSPTAEDVTAGDKTSSVEVGGVSVAELSLNENVIVKPGERVIEPHTSASPDPVVEEVVTLVAEPTGAAEKVVAVVTSPVEYVSLNDDAVPLVDKAKAFPTAADDLPAEQKGEKAPAIGKLSVEKTPLTEDIVGKLGGDPVAVEPVVFEKVGIIDKETVLKVDQSSVEVPFGADIEKAHTKDAPIEGAAEMTTEANPVVVEPQGAESIDVVSHEERTGADEPSIVVEKVKEDGVHAAPSSGTGTTADEAPGIERKGVEEEANTQLDDYVPSGQGTSSTESIVASLVEEKPEEGETPAQVDQSVIEDNNITDESQVVDSSIEVNDSTPIAVVEAPVVIDLHETELTLTPTASLDEVAVNPVSNLPLTEREPNIDVGSHSATLLTPVGAEIEHPKSPWTPSYSVTTQGPGIPAEEDIPAIEDLPSSLSQVPVVALTPVDSSAPLDEVQTQSSSEILEDRPKSPWTPSYSVSVQGSPLHGTVALDEIERVDGTIVTDIPVADEPASSQTNISDEVKAATELVEDESQEEESIVQLQSTLITEEQREATGEVVSASAPESVIEKIIDDIKLPIEEEHTSLKELTTDTGIDRPASPRATSYSATEGIVSTASESTLATSLVPENVIFEESSQVEEPYAPQESMHEVADKPEVTIISQPVVIAEDAATSEPPPTGAVGIEVHDLHAVERPVELVASPSVELQSERTDGIASTPELDDNLEKPVDVKVDVESHAEETVVSSEESQLPVVQEPVLSSTPLAHEDAVVDQTPEVEEPSVSSTTIPEVQSVRIDAGEVVPQTYVAAEAEAVTETLPTVDESPKDPSFVKTVSAQLESDSVIQEVIPTPEPVSEAEVKLRVQVSSSEELLTPAPEIERPASPWTPSYSVTQQGHVTPTSEVETILPTSGADIDSPAPNEHIVQAEPTPEDLSTNVEPSIELPQVLAVVPDVSGGRETAKEDPEDVHPSTTADVEILHESDTTLLSANTEIDRPSSPWTPSYSVTQQGRASPVPESDLDVESAENEGPAKDGLDEDIASLVPDPQRQVESSEPVVVAHTPVPAAEDEPKLPVEGEIASSVLEHEHEVAATQEEPLGQVDAPLTIPVVEEVPVVAAVPLAGPELHAVIASTPEPEVGPVVKEEPAESVLDVRAVPTVPEPGNDLEPAVEDDTVSVEKHKGVTVSSPEPAVNGKQAEEGHKEEVVLAAPELEFDAESSVKNETVVSEPLARVKEEESKGGERVVSHAQVPVDEIKSVVKDEPGEDGDDEAATSVIPVSIEKEKQAETGHVSSPEVESVVNDELVQEEEVTLPTPEPEHDSKPALEDVQFSDKTELHVAKAPLPVPESELQNVAPEQDTESVVKDETVGDGHDNQVVSPAPVSATKEEYDEQVVPLAEESSAKGETAGDEHDQHTAIVPESEQHIETVVEDKLVVQDELIKERQDNEVIPASSEPAVEDEPSEEQVAAPSSEFVREIEAAAVVEPVADDHNEPVAATEPEPYVEPVVEAKVEHVATPAPDLHHEIEAVEKEVEEPAANVLDEQASLPVPEPESAVVEVEPVASPAPVEIKSESAIVDDSALLQDSSIESKANDEQIEVFVTKEVPGSQEDATLPAPKAEPESVAKAEEGQVVQEIESAAEEEVEGGHEVVEEHVEQEASTVQESSAKDEPTHAEQVAVPVLETEQRTEVVVDAKEAEDEPVAPELVAEDEPDKDGHDDEAVPQDKLPEGRDEGITPPAPDLDSPAKDESLKDEQATSPAAQRAPVLKEEPADAEPIPEKKVEEPVPEPGAVKDEVVIPPAPEPATEIKSLEEVALAAPELDSPVKEKAFEDEQATSPAAQLAPVLKEQVDIEPVPELQQEIKKEVDEPAGDVQAQFAVPEPAVVEEEPVIPPAPEPATEIKPLVEGEPDVEPKAEEGIESAVKDEDQPAVPPVAEIKNEPVISPTPELVTEAKSLEPTVEPDVEEQTVVPVSVILPPPELVTEVESVAADEPSVELYVEPKAEDVQVEIKSAVKEDQVEDKPESEHVRSEQAASPEPVTKDEPEPQQEQVEKIEVELAKEEALVSVVKEEQVEAAASEEQSSLEQVHVEPAEEASDDKQEAEPATKDEDAVAADSVEENTIDSRELSVDTSSFTDSTKSPWTPSHSMTTQDVGSPDVEMKKDLPGQAFPVTEEDRKSVGSLDTVNESADVVPETLEVPFTRKRLESSASARLLRGALHKVPEGRASLDMAQGEFTKLPSPVVDTSAVGIVETLTTEQESGSASSDESDGSSDDSSEAEHKGRWCVVM